MDSIPEDTLFQFNPDTLQCLRKQYDLNKLRKLKDSVAIWENWLKKQEHFVKKEFQVIMDPIQFHPLLEVTDEELRSVRQVYNLDATVVKESLDVIQEWTKKQDHLIEACQHLDRNMIERLLVLARGSVEGTKMKIDKLFTTRGMMPELNLKKNFNEFEKLLDCLIYTPLPKLNPKDYSRVTVTQWLPENSENFSLLSYLRFCLLVGEFRIYYDYNLSERYVLDLKNFTLNIVPKLNPILLKKAEIMSTECFGTRIKGIHLLNAPPFVDKIVYILKQGLREKVASRLYVHSSYEEFHKEVSKEILPKDFDGDGPSLSKTAEQWKSTLSSDNARDICERFNKFVTDESKRSVEIFNEEYLGMPGTFKKLTVD